jgi:hypothetical protein
METIASVRLGLLKFWFRGPICPSHIKKMFYEACSMIFQGVPPTPQLNETHRREVRAARTAIHDPYSIHMALGRGSELTKASLSNSVQVQKSLLCSVYSLQGREFSVKDGYSSLTASLKASDKVNGMVFSNRFLPAPIEGRFKWQPWH